MTTYPWQRRHPPARVTALGIERSASVLIPPALAEDIDAKVQAAEAVADAPAVEGATE
jgi:hypothetical protein